MACSLFSATHAAQGQLRLFIRLDVGPELDFQGSFSSPELHQDTCFGVLIPIVMAQVQTSAVWQSADLQYLS